MFGRHWTTNRIVFFVESLSTGCTLFHFRHLRPQKIIQIQTNRKGTNKNNSFSFSKARLQKFFNCNRIVIRNLLTPLSSPTLGERYSDFEDDGYLKITRRWRICISFDTPLKRALILKKGICFWTKMVFEVFWALILFYHLIACASFLFRKGNDRLGRNAYFARNRRSETTVPSPESNQLSQNQILKETTTSKELESLVEMSPYTHNYISGPHINTSIFCNVELNGANLQAVGFDMDFTLAQVSKSPQVLKLHDYLLVYFLIFV